jgi:hypothetical protein
VPPTEPELGPESHFGIRKPPLRSCLITVVASWARVWVGTPAVQAACEQFAHGQVAVGGGPRRGSGWCGWSSASRRARTTIVAPGERTDTLAYDINDRGDIVIPADGTVLRLPEIACGHPTEPDSSPTASPVEIATLTSHNARAVARG